jgi:hypothetical protein
MQSKKEIWWSINKQFILKKECLYTGKFIATLSVMANLEITSIPIFGQINHCHF